MGEKNSKCLLILAVILSAAALTVSLLLLGWTVFVELTESDDIAELRNRLEDLETEHDYILEKEVIPATKSLISPPQFCSLLPDPGPCGSQVTRWYYLPREEDCIQFPWGGCQGNDNNFVSIHQCRAACHVPQDKQVSSSQRPILPIPTMSTLPSLKENFSPSDCQLPPDAGPCQDRITRFYYDGGECQRFQYGGCSGNGNNFFSMSECERHCEEDVHLIMRKDHNEEGVRKRHRMDSCTLPEDTGTCSGSLTRFRWDQETKECLTFAWTGCGGNSNNFKTRQKCWKRCGREGV
eukprot:TRINITY_DN12682_c0_g1_i6.p1 TRINITY_DN12682_c0_g1~~TRINITY_DN12682_c0_g1_i6.p1  ORF type:complete len:294 (-),score=61.12 TRINITY_DN12682_c0_g1_i6:23-904(-)